MYTALARPLQFFVTLPFSDSRHSNTPFDPVYTPTSRNSDTFPADTRVTVSIEKHLQSHRNSICVCNSPTSRPTAMASILTSLTETIPQQNPQQSPRPPSALQSNTKPPPPSSSSPSSSTPVKRMLRCPRCPRRKYRTARDLALHILTTHRQLHFEGHTLRLPHHHTHTHLPLPNANNTHTTTPLQHHTLPPPHKQTSSDAIPESDVESITLSSPLWLADTSNRDHHLHMQPQPQSPFLHPHPNDICPTPTPPPPTNTPTTRNAVATSTPAPAQLQPTDFPSTALLSQHSRTLQNANKRTVASVLRKRSQISSTMAHVHLPIRSSNPSPVASHVAYIVHQHTIHPRQTFSTGPCRSDDDNEEEEEEEIEEDLEASGGVSASSSSSYKMSSDADSLAYATDNSNEEVHHNTDVYDDGDHRYQDHRSGAVHAGDQWMGDAQSPPLLRLRPSVSSSDTSSCASSESSSQRRQVSSKSIVHKRYERYPCTTFSERRPKIAPHTSTATTKSSGRPRKHPKLARIPGTCQSKLPPQQIELDFSNPVMY